MALYSVGLLEGWHGRRAMLPSCGSGLRAACRPDLGVLPEAGPNLLLGREDSVLDVSDKPNKSLRKILGKLIPFGWSLEEEI